MQHRLRCLQALDGLADVFSDGGGQQVFRFALAGAFHGGLDGVDQFGQMAGQFGFLFQDLDRGVHRATVVVAQHQDQRRVQNLGGVFEAGQTIVIDEVSRDPNDEDIARVLVEGQLRRYPGIRATEYRGDRLLRFDASRPAR
ncbi:hypothetical protein D3C72_1556460 [compost metagenome]